MNKNKYLINILFWTVCLSISACVNQPTENSLSKKIIADSLSKASNQANSAVADSLAQQKIKLTNIYSQAIDEFISAVFKKDKTIFDTLYFGKHIYGQPDDFPDIELPETINNTKIKLVSPEIGKKKQQESKSLVYINMMGWVDSDKASFLFVVFSNGAQHQYDYFIDFKYNTSQNKFELEKIEYENYRLNTGQKTKRILIYNNGKYIKDK